MKKFITVTIVCLLALGWFALTTQAKSPNQLLQDGLYAEETEGDLEKAIGIYEKVIKETDVHQQTAASATYHLGMCYLKKGDKTKAAEYFQKVKSNYPTQKILVKKANTQLQKVSSREDIIARSYVIHYMTLDQSKNGLELLNKVHPRGVRTHHAGRYRNNGKRINSICTDNEDGKDKLVAAIKESDELELVKVVPPAGQAKESVFEQIDYQVIQFIGEQYGKIATEARQQYLLVNSHIYYVDADGFLFWGGMNAFYNRTGQTIKQKISLGGTSYKNQTLYGVDGQELNTEIVPNKTRPNHWQIYLTPDEPLAPEEILYYGWSRNSKIKLPKTADDLYSLKMHNTFGSPVTETFFLVLPKEMKVSQSNPPTGSEKLLNFDVYWWSETVQHGETHVEKVNIEKSQLAKPRLSDEKVVESAVMTISTCAESDPRVTMSLESLKDVENNFVVGELTKYLDAKTATVRRSAIYILWKGSLADISDAVPRLEKLCSHNEATTRGMAAITLGAAKINSSFGILSNMTLRDSSGYARRCAAYALGLMGRLDAKPVLEKALKDSDKLVKQNAEHALKLLKEAEAANKNK